MLFFSYRWTKYCINIIKHTLPPKSGSKATPESLIADEHESMKLIIHPDAEKTILNSFYNCSISNYNMITPVNTINTDGCTLTNNNHLIHKMNIENIMPGYPVMNIMCRLPHSYLQKMVLQSSWLEYQDAWFLSNKSIQCIENKHHKEISVNYQICSMHISLFKS